MRFPSFLYRLRARLGLRRAEVAVLPRSPAHCSEAQESVLLVFGEGRTDGTSFRTFGKENVRRFLSKLAWTEGSLTIEVPGRGYRDAPLTLVVPAWTIRKVSRRARRLLDRSWESGEMFLAAESATSTVSTESCRLPYPVPRP